VEKFPVQGLLATNELPKSYLSDPKGSVARRLLVFPWNRVISPRDPTLKSRIIREELPARHFDALATPVKTTIWKDRAKMLP
jgi:hypothetical protein